MQVRLATGEDAAAVEAIRIGGWQIAYRHIFPADELDALPVDASRWRERLASPPPGWTTFVCESEDGVVGFASVGPSRDFAGVGELYAIYVDPEAWSAGAGRA